MTAALTINPPRRWVVRAALDERARRLASSLSISETLAALLIARGCDDEAQGRALLNPAFAELHDPYLMKGMREAVGRVLRAIESGERILIYGDYDVDGTTGTVVLRRALEVLGARTGYHVPHRFTEGYGIRRDVLERAKEEGYSLVISVDCGIRAFEPLEWARDNKLDVIVTDHHLPDDGEGAPPAFAVLNPNQRGCEYPDKNLAGVGVAFKLSHALFRERGKEELVRGFLKVVAIGTVADMAQLVGENRAIVSLGLSDLPRAKNPGLRALMDVAGCGGDGVAMRAFDIGFRIGPRINAAGRMDAARAVVELFEAKTEAEARRLAEHLDSRNQERRRVQAQVTDMAFAEFAAAGEDAGVALVAGRGWHRGVVGLAASKLCERTGLPSIVISLDEDGTGHGSARSTEEFHMLDALTACADLLEGFGGHAHAAGLVVRQERIAELRRRLSEHASALPCSGASGEPPCLYADLELPPEAVSLALCEELSALEPFGMGWPCPVFVTKGLTVAAPPRVMKERHLKFNLRDDNGHTHEAVWWNAAQTLSATPGAGRRIELAYTVEANRWNGNTRLQLVVEDMKGSE